MPLSGHMRKWIGCSCSACRVRIVEARRWRALRLDLYLFRSASSPFTTIQFSSEDPFLSPVIRVRPPPALLVVKKRWWRAKDSARPARRSCRSHTHARPARGNVRRREFTAIIIDDKLRKKKTEFKRTGLADREKRGRSKGGRRRRVRLYVN